MLSKIKHMSFSVGLFALSALANAENMTGNGSGFYFGLGLGQSNTHNVKQMFITNTVPPSTITVTPSNTGIGERLFFGYNINKFAGMEMGYTHYAAATYSIPSSANISCSNPAVRESGIDFDAKGMYPFGMSGFNAFIKGGFAFMRSSSSGSLQPDTTTSVCNSTSSGTVSTVRPLIAIGVGYNLTQNWITDLSFQRVSSGGGIQEATLVGVSISYHIVDEYCGQFLC